MNDRIRELDVFLRVTDEASFSAAARSPDCNPSTVGKLILRLENRLGVRLFHRTSRALKLTQEGARFLEGAQRVIDALEDAETVVGQGTREATGVLRVSSTVTFAQYLLVPLVPEFLKRNPSIKLELFLTATTVDIFENQIDVSLQSGHIPDSSLIARRIATTRWLMCASPGYLAEAGIPASADDLERHNCLNFLPGSFRSIWPVGQGPSAKALNVQGNVGANSAEILRLLACQGLGIARLADYVVASDLAGGRLVQVLPKLQPEENDPVFAIFPSKRHLSSRVQVFLDFLTDRLSQTRAVEKGSVSA